MRSMRLRICICTLEGSETIRKDWKHLPIDLKKPSHNIFSSWNNKKRLKVLYETLHQTYLYSVPVETIRKDWKNLITPFSLAALILERRETIRKDWKSFKCRKLGIREDICRKWNNKKRLKAIILKTVTTMFIVSENTWAETIRKDWKV